MCMSLRTKTCNKFRELGPSENVSASFALLPTAEGVDSAIEGYKWRYVAANILIQAPNVEAVSKPKGGNPAPILKLVEASGTSSMKNSDEVTNHE